MKELCRDTFPAEPVGKKKKPYEHLPLLALFCIVMGFCTATIGATPNLTSTEASDIQVEVLKDIMVPMRDGMKLATDIYLPSKSGQRLAGRFPVVVARTPYNKDYASGDPVEY